MTYDRIAFEPPEVPLWSATAVAPYPDTAEEVRQLCLRHLVEPVRFRQLAEAMHEAGFRVFVQMGFGSVSAFLDDSLHDREICTLNAGSAKHPGMAQLLRLAAGLWSEGAPVRFEELAARGAGSDGAGRPGHGEPLALAPDRPPKGQPLRLGVPLVRMDPGAVSLGVTNGSPAPGAGPNGSPVPGAGANGSPAPAVAANGSPAPGAGTNGSPAPAVAANGSPAPGAGPNGSAVSSAGPGSGLPAPATLPPPTGGVDSHPVLEAYRMTMAATLDAGQQVIEAWSRSSRWEPGVGSQPLRSDEHGRPLEPPRWDEHGRPLEPKRSEEHALPPDPSGFLPASDPPSDPPSEPRPSPRPESKARLPW